MTTKTRVTGDEEEDINDEKEGEGGLHPDAAAASVRRCSKHNHRGGRRGGGAGSSAQPQQRGALSCTDCAFEGSCALSARKTRLYAALEREDRARCLQSLVDDSPQIQAILRQATLAANT